MRAASLLPIILTLGLFGCGGDTLPQTRAALDGLSVDRLPGWATEQVAEAIPPLLQACPRLAPAWRVACAEARYLVPGDENGARAFLRRNFQAVPLGRTLFTGYFEIEVPGSRTRGGPYQVPVLRAPRDPRRFSRAEIAAGALAGQGLETLWLTSAADLYFLQLQGSGRVRLPDGGTVRLGYAASNGHAPVPTDTLFRDAGIPGNDLSIPGLRAWIAQHPADGLARLAGDASYVFLRDDSANPAGRGHVGAQGAPLVPLRSIAVDPAYIPLGSPVWLDTTDSYTGHRLQRLMLAGDTGDTIRGPAHADIYYGWDQGAEARGGHQYARGDAWMLRPVAADRLAAIPDQLGPDRPGSSPEAGGPS